MISQNMPVEVNGRFGYVDDSVSSVVVREIAKVLEFF